MITLRKIFLILFAAVTPVTIFAQNITNTLGSAGTFRIKDNTTTFFTLSQSTGYIDITNSINLPSTTSNTTGIIFKNSNPFIHDYSLSGTLGNNLFIGSNAGSFFLSGTGTSASNNIGIGNYSLNGLTTGYNNIAIGYGALYSVGSGHDNLAIGLNVLSTSNGSRDNTGVGQNSLANNTLGNGNSAFGKMSLQNNTTGYSNSAFGIFALDYNTTGFGNTALGQYSLYGNTTGHENTAIGENTLVSLTGDLNTAVGSGALYNTSSGENTGVGEYSLFNNITGAKNTCIGGLSGFITHSGSNITCVGYNSNPSSNSVSNQITLGDNNVTSLRCNVTTITSLSDARDKKNIRDLDLGIDFIMKLRPRLFNWDKREWYGNNISDGSKTKEEPTAGFIAQELDTVQTSESAEYLKLVLKDNPEKLEASAGNLLPIIVKAIQDLKVENEELKSELSNLKRAVTEIKSGQKTNNVLTSNKKKDLK